MNIPVVLFIFKRKNTLSRIFNVLRIVRPKKLYLLADGARTDAEKIEVEAVREYVLSLVDWECEIIKDFSEVNLGVHRRIGEGAKWVFNREEYAIFLEDDNLPEPTFFRYCEELLYKYKDDSEIFWICGTNYLEKTNSEYSYYFTRHLLPCGWASWSKKFNLNYDSFLDSLTETNVEKMKSTYIDPLLYKQDVDLIYKTKRFIENEPKTASWDRQVTFSVRSKGLYGISPVFNLIRNIGVDEHSTHGGNSLNKVMTSRFCEKATFPLEFPLRHPSVKVIDRDYEERIEKIILYPLNKRIMIKLAKLIKPLLGIRHDESLVLKFKRFFK